MWYNKSDNSRKVKHMRTEADRYVYMNNEEIKEAFESQGV